MPVVSGQEPNVVDDENIPEEEESSPSVSYSPPTKPKGLNAKRATSTAVKTTVNITRKILEIFAAMPLPLKIAVAAIIAIIIIVVVILKAEASESTKQMTTSIDEVISNSKDLSEEAKKAYEETGSLIKLPLNTILEIYEYFEKEGEFAGSEIKENYQYVLGKNEVKIREGSSNSSSSSSSSQVSADMSGLVQKALELAEKGGVIYCQNERQLVSTVEELNNVKKWDCSSFVYSMFKACLGIDVDSNTEAIKAKGDRHYSENGWTAETHSIGDGELQPGDILYRSGHVGIYVGDNKQVDHGGPGSSCACSSDWRGPKHKNVSSSYTHYIRYKK